MTGTSVRRSTPGRPRARPSWPRGRGPASDAGATAARSRLTHLPIGIEPTRPRERADRRRGEVGQNQVFQGESMNAPRWIVDLGVRPYEQSGLLVRVARLDDRRD